MADKKDHIVIEEDQEDAAWEAEQGIPQPSDPFIQRHLQNVEKLIEQEYKHRSDRDFRELLSPMAQEACAIVGQIRFEEQQTLWSAEEADKLAHEKEVEVYPGMLFTLAKERMESSKLWKIIRRMPKGALIHCHFEAMIDQPWLFREALTIDGLHISADQSLHSLAARRSAIFNFNYKKDKLIPSTSIWDADYVPDTPMLLTAAADAFPDGGREGFIKWCVSRCSITFEDSLKHHLGTNEIWRKFMGGFRLISTLVYYEPIYRKFVQRVLRLLAEDGVQWVDFRAVFRANFMKEGSETRENDFVELFRALDEEIEKFKLSEEGKNFWGARMIWTSMRALDNRAICENMKACIETKIAYPHLIAGFDLVGQEDLGRSLADLTPLLFWFRKQCAEAGVTIPFFFHAGETQGTGSEPDINLFDAISLGTRRLGHAISLYKHPLLMNLVRDKRICVECCPISNEVLRLTGGIMSHPFPALLAQGVPVALSNDDPGMLGHETAGMSHDFYQAVQGVENLGLEGLAALAENSVRWAAYEDLSAQDWTEDIKAGMYGTGVRAKRMKEWRSQWEKFCMDVVMEFGPDMDTEQAGEVMVDLGDGNESGQTK